MKFEHTVFCYILREFDTSSPHGLSNSHYLYSFVVHP